MKQPPSTPSTGQINRNAGGQSPVAKREGGSLRDDTRPDNGQATGGPEHFDTPESIARRLRQTRANMIGTDDEQHYFDCHEAAAEIERLRRWGRLTDEERKAIQWFGTLSYGEGGRVSTYAATLRSLLARLA